ncbi:MAG TPA: hypothetical protein VH062_33000 [Polyangiaceae bacterium]|jgi:hypothetical protein|nr:hypothetical protein [Polyangiaceae bacterium]
MSVIAGSVFWGCSPDFQDCATTHTCSPGSKSDAGVSEAGTLSANGGASGTGGKGAAGGSGMGTAGTSGTGGVSGMGAAGSSANGNGGDAGSVGRDGSVDAGVPDAAIVEPDASLDASVGTTTPDASDGAPAPAPCDTTHYDCDGNASNGCETDISLNVANCGGCRIACQTTGTTALSCIAGVCKPTCAAGRLDCDGDGKNGCEVDSQNDATNCGACKYACSAKNATAACAKGACTPACSKGFGDCAHPARPAADDGCETDLGKPVSCGVCGHDCVDGDCGSDGKCLEVTISDNVQNPVSVTVDPTYVHWTQTENTPNATTGAIMRTLVKGGGMTTVASGQENPWAIANDGAYVYWCNRSSGDPSIRRQLFGTSGNGTVIVSDPGVMMLPSPLAVDGTNVYWADYSLRQVYKEAKDGSGPSVVLTPAFNIAAFDLKVDGPNVYWDGPVFAPISGAAATVKPTDVPSGHGSFFAIDATYIYYEAYIANKDTYARTLKTLTGPVQALLPETSITRALAVDATYLYIAADSGIIRLPKAGGTATTLVPSPGVVTSMVVAGNAIYWIDSGSFGAMNGRVMKLPL